MILQKINCKWSTKLNYYKIIILLFIVFTRSVAYSQMSDFDIKQEILAKNNKTIVYLTAIWCLPCMNELPDIIDSFKNEKEYKLVIWFERQIMDTATYLHKKLINKFGADYFHLFPLKYYSSYKNKLIVINYENKILKNILKEINQAGQLKIKWSDFSWGKLILIDKEKVIVANGEKRGNQINQILNYIQSKKQTSVH